MSCLICKHFIPGGADGVERLREIILKTKLHQTGDCAFNPIHVAVATDHECGQYEGSRKVYQDSQAEELETFLHGHWFVRQRVYLDNEIKRLKEALAIARRISASRLKRLRERASS